MKHWKWLMVLPLVGLFGYFGSIKLRSLNVPDDGEPLAVRWEGFYHDQNDRDVGQSLNECLDSRIFRPGVLLRSAGWFSGWNCDLVGNPDVIFSLNYSPSRQERYFCQRDDEKVIGRYDNPAVQLNNLEFTDTWQDEAMRSAACGFARAILEAIADGRKVLIHCDAGRDRTGAMAALIAAAAAEQQGLLDNRIIAATECDYRKTRSLVPEKFGRIENWIGQLAQEGGVTGFLQRTCEVSDALMSQVGERFLLPDPEAVSP
jgi:hypothetical protein